MQPLKHATIVLCAERKPGCHLVVCQQGALEVGLDAPGRPRWGLRPRLRRLSHWRTAAETLRQVDRRAADVDNHRTRARDVRQADRPLRDSAPQHKTVHPKQRDPAIAELGAPAQRHALAVELNVVDAGQLVAVQG